MTPGSTLGSGDPSAKWGLFHWGAILKFWFLCLNSYRVAGLLEQLWRVTCCVSYKSRSKIREDISKKQQQWMQSSFWFSLEFYQTKSMGKQGYQWVSSDTYTLTLLLLMFYTNIILKTRLEFYQPWNWSQIKRGAELDWPKIRKLWKYVVPVFIYVFAHAFNTDLH